MSEKLPILDCGNLSKYMRDSCGLEKKKNVFIEDLMIGMLMINQGKPFKQTTIQSKNYNEVLAHTD